MRRYYITDHLGSTRAVVNNGGDLKETFDYYPFGLLMPKRYTSGNNTLQKFTGKERDEAIGLDYFGARYYDPALGRWTTTDPILNEKPPNELLEKDVRYLSQSPYNYVHNNPMYYVDPDGKQIAAHIYQNAQIEVRTGISLKQQPSKPISVSNLQTGLDVAGLAPGVGEAFDAANALIYLGQGDYTNAGLSAAAMIPFGGLAATGGKFANKAIKSSTKLLPQFTSVESLIGKAGKLVSKKSGKIGTITGNAPNIFEGLSKQYGAKIQYTTEGVPFFKKGSTSVHLYKSKTTNLPTLSIKKNEEIFKIRVEK